MFETISIRRQSRLAFLAIGLGLSGCEPTLSNRGAARSSIAPCFPAFTYAGEPFAASAWSNQLTQSFCTNGAAVTIGSYLSPDHKLRLTLETRVYADFPVTELRPVLETVGNEPTARVDDFHSFALNREVTARDIRIRCVTGSRTRATDFTRRDAILMGRAGCDSFSLQTAQGVSSSDWLPYFGVDFAENEGLELAVGWSGAWQADFHFDGKRFTLEAGLETSHFKMLPGERFQLPSMLVFTRHGMSRRQGSVLFHRFLIAHKAPRDAAGVLYPPHLFLIGGFGSKTDADLLAILNLRKRFPALSFDAYWIDADWYGAPPGEPAPLPGKLYWWRKVGDWRVDTRWHPAGNLRVIADAVHAAGQKLLLWFEPERAGAMAPGLKAHPEFFLRNPADPNPDRNLVNLGNPAARQWLFETIAGVIESNRVDIYRQDFNMPEQVQGVWRAADAPDRQGVTEIKYINGLYAFWDALRGRFNQMLLENCAAGGRRMDYELMSRSHSYCRDDAHMDPHPEELSQNITLNSTAYIPFTGGDTMSIAKHDDYGFVSCIAAGTLFHPTASGFLYGQGLSEADIAWYAKMLTLAKRMQPYFGGDFYALTEPAFDSSEIWCAYQCDDPVAHAGFFVAYRREKCREPSLALELGGIVPEGLYEVEIVDGGKRIMRGSELAHDVVSLATPRSFQLVFYHLQKKGGS